ncbi:amidase domain-containing protein [Kitasatospora sp. KL5]|uniref:amidase domain-containing protein n=1 Tax=Kitasatospora sp. KL5 TaxID=3425125 RepID=UPI003D6E85DE
MVDFAALKNAHPSSWQAAAEDWLSLSKHALEAAQEIRDQGSRPLEDNWTDAVGQQAADELRYLADRFEAGADIMRGVTMVVDGLASAMEYAQRTLLHALDLAEAYELDVDADGSVSTRGEVTSEKLTHMTDVSDLIKEALRQAREADALALPELNRLMSGTCEADPAKALDEAQTSASHTQMNILAAGIPKGDDPQVVRDWWAGLTAEEQRQLMLAEPVKIANLDGIPEDVKQDLHGRDGKYDRVKQVQWALEHWNDTSIDKLDNNCTNFASESLRQGGVKEKPDSGWGLGWSDDSWGRDDDADSGWLDERTDYSKSWGAAENLQNFMLENGGYEVPASEARPGDLVFYEQAGENEHIEKGNTHHAAVVTAVTPDGDIKYTQHTTSRQNVSLDGRLPATEKAEGEQRVRIVRVSPNWY